MEKKLFLLKIQIFDVNELVECNLFVQLQHLGYFFDTSITPFFFFFTPHYLDFSHLTVDWLWVILDPKICWGCVKNLKFRTKRKKV